jgi:hypothetical protein
MNKIYQIKSLFKQNLQGYYLTNYIIERNYY